MIICNFVCIILDSECSSIIENAKNMAYEDRYKEFEQYLTSRKPGQREKADAWQTAIVFSSVYYVSRWNISNTCI